MLDYLQACLGFGTILLLGYVFVYIHNKTMKREQISFKIYYYTALVLYLFLGGK